MTKKIALTAAILMAMASGAVADDSPAPVIDLSTSNDHKIVEEAYQSVRPGALDERFASGNRTGNTEVTLSYEDEDEAETKDEYGIVRDKPFERNEHGQPEQAD